MSIGLNKTLDGKWEVARESLRSDLITIETILNQLKVNKGVLAARAGGTGFGTYVVGDLLYANTTTTLARLADVATGNVLLSGGIGVAPAWGKVSLSSAVSGILPVANGGSGAASFTAHGVLLGNGSSAFGVTAVGATNTVLHGNTGADPTFSAVVEADLSLSDVVTDNVSITKHGFAPKAPNDATKFLDGTGNYSTPSGGGGISPYDPGTSITIPDGHFLVMAGQLILTGSESVTIAGNGQLSIVS